MKNFASWCKWAAASAALALLAACGGGDDPVNSASWASPAAFVPAGSASKSFAASGCSRSAMQGSSPLYTVSVVITSAGDMSVVGSTTVTGAPVTLVSIPFASATNANWGVSGTTQTPSYYISSTLRGVDMDTTWINVQISNPVTEQISMQPGQLYANNASDSSSIFCETVAGVSLQLSPSAARVAQNLGTAAGVTTYDTGSGYAGTITSGIMSWENQENSPEYSFFKLNLGSGELSASATATGTFSVVSLSLPTANSMGYPRGGYGESVCRNFDESGAVAKAVFLYYDTDVTAFYTGATAYGNKIFAGAYEGCGVK
jgi:hypothetical protein